MNLYIIRHAIAVDEGTPEYEEDSLRPLTDKGKKKMIQIAKGIRALSVKFDLILSSPYVRAKETAEILADVFKMKKEIEFSENLALMGDPNLLIAELNEKYRENSIALVGHQPHLTQLISLLISDGQNMNITLKKGSVCNLAIDDLRQPHSARLEWLLTPGILVALGEK